jgi:riboflavin synthase
MFTGIIEQLGVIKEIEQENDNIHFFIESQFTSELKIDQSVAHDGCCLTVVQINQDVYKVTAINETLDKTCLSSWKKGYEVNLERCMILNGRLDGHIVQGHVDTTAKCVSIKNENGSWRFTFEYQSSHLTVEKGSISINGVSLTVVDSNKNTFSVCIIPYTYEFTNFKSIEIGGLVNLEFDIIGKYVSKHLESHSD